MWNVCQDRHGISNQQSHEDSAQTKNRATPHTCIASAISMARLDSKLSLPNASGAITAISSTIATTGSEVKHSLRTSVKVFTNKSLVSHEGWWVS